MTSWFLFKAWLRSLFRSAPTPVLGHAPVTPSPKAQALADLSKLVPEHWLDMLEPYIADEVHRPVGDSYTSQREYDALCALEHALVRQAQHYGGLNDIHSKYGALAYFLAGAHRQIKGARQQYEQLLFDGTPADVNQLGTSDAPDL
jgi:hypothetical protein